MTDTFQGSDVISVTKYIRAHQLCCSVLLLWCSSWALFVAASPLSGPCYPIRMTITTGVTVPCARLLQPTQGGSMPHITQGGQDNSPSFYRWGSSETISLRGRTRACMGHTHAGGCGAQAWRGMVALRRPSLYGHTWFPQCDCCNVTRKMTLLGPGYLGLQPAPIPYTC